MQKPEFIKDLIDFDRIAREEEQAIIEQIVILYGGKYIKRIQRLHEFHDSSRIEGIVDKPNNILSASRLKIYFSFLQLLALHYISKYAKTRIHPRTQRNGKD